MAETRSGSRSALRIDFLSWLTTHGPSFVHLRIAGVVASAVARLTTNLPG
jgi:hypothetical protein